VTQINVLDTLGLISASFGDWDGVPGGEHVELTDKASPAAPEPAVQRRCAGRLQRVGWTEHVGVMRGLVEGQVKLGEWKDKLLHDPTR
jgi:hypothetical protein